MEPPSHDDSGPLTGARRDNGGIRVEAALSCPVCGHPGDVRYSELVDRSWDAPGTWSFRECRQCGHLWIDPRPVPEDIGRLYATYYTHGISRPSPLQAEGFWPSCRRGVLEAIGYPGIARSSKERFLGKALRFIPPIWEECEEIAHSVRGPPRGRLLDIGCGDGHFLQSMRELGWTVQGLESDPRAAAAARDHGLSIFEGPIERASLDADAFEVVTMAHVIEHVLDPVAVLAAARRVLKPGGRLYIFTPNADAWGHSLFGPSWYPLEPPRHLHVFRPGNLIQCATRAQLQVLHVRTMGRQHLLFDGSVSIRRTGRYHGFDNPAEQASIAERLFRLIENLLVHVARRRGEEIMVISTKGMPG